MAVKVRVKRRSSANDVADAPEETRYKKRSVAGANATRHSVHATISNAKKTARSAAVLARNSKKLRREATGAVNSGGRVVRRLGRAASKAARGDFAGAGRSLISAGNNALVALRHTENANRIARPLVRNADRTRRSVRAAYRRGRNTIRNAQRAADVRSTATGGRAASDASKA